VDLGLVGRRALVCGSTSGLGRAAAEQFAREGCRVAVNGRDDARTARAADELATANDATVVAAPGDVSDPAGVQRVVERAVAQLGGLDILLCNAGGPAATTVAEADDAQWRDALALSLLSTVNLCRAVVPAMRDRRWGRIVCLASVAAKQVVPGLVLSTTARAGLLGFAKSLSDEVAADGVTVNVVCPGYMRTERLIELMEARARRVERSVDEVTAALVEAVPAHRIGEPDELAAAIVFLASEPARYITGAVLQVDGGAIRSII
jgi:3-oxoacyl-[acyl-carrier protein] reductase